MSCLTLIPILSFLGLSTFFAKRMSVTIQHAIPIFASILIATLYIAASLSILFYITILIYCAGLAAWYLVYREDNEIINHLKTRRKMLLALFAAISAAGLYYNHAYLSAWDDFSFWGMASKELLIRHKFESAGSTTSILDMFLHYPRGSAIFHYYMMLPTEFYEGSLLFSHFLLLLIFLAPLFNQDKIQESFAMFLVIIGVSTLLTSVLRSIYNDIIIGYIFSAILVIYFSSDDKDRNLWKLLPLLCALPLIKEIGQINGIIAVCIIGYYHLTIQKKIPLIGRSDTHITLGILLAAPIFVYQIHSWYFLYLHGSIGRNTHTFSNIYNILANFGVSDLWDIFRFLKLVLFLTVKESSIMLYGLVYFAYIYSKKQDHALFLQFKTILRLMLISLGAFLLWRLYINIFIFRYMTDGSMGRYLASFTISFAVISIYFLAKSFLVQHHTKKEKYGQYALLLLSAILTFQALDRVPTFISLDEEVYLSQINEAQEYIKSGKKLAFSFENKNGDQACHEFAFRMSPYLPGSDTATCLDTASNNRRNIYLGTIRKIPDTVPEGCYVTYAPFLLDYELTCPSSN